MANYICPIFRFATQTFTGGYKSKLKIDTLSPVPRGFPRFPKNIGGKRDRKNNFALSQEYKPKSLKLDTLEPPIP